MPKISVSYLQVQQHDQSFLLVKIPAEHLTKISYAAVRRQDQEEGAIQRVLNKSRINAIKDFTINKGQFPNVIVLNWINQEEPLSRVNGNLTISAQPRSAQLIDGQHRVAGLLEAIIDMPQLGALEIPVAIYENLTTAQCANLFLAINTEQKPVPRSLVFDLYGIADEQMVDAAAVRARDIVMTLHENDSSPYFGLIKLPSSARKKGGVALSTAVTAIKPLVEEKGDFEQINVLELELQTQSIVNFFSAIKEKYEHQWDAPNNAFLYAAGFVGAIDFFKKKLIPYCVMRRSFSKQTIADALTLSSDNVILQEEIKGLGGKDAPKIIFDRLTGYFVPVNSETGQIQF